ncbi:hypothetical protein G7Y89_g6987 [Cudoniella acicularis]|uniref:Uncharacterized protein n=1 Tax=Cudoniella acicularis TaxID=354080 RepID=A0A8H4RLQ6_9HELO|nr:hypothetical protein G7Y89_g6987 [Cudoniella acicularis]
MSLSYSIYTKSLRFPPSVYNNGLDAEEGFASAYFERAPSLPVERRIEHVSAVPGEQTYDVVPILGAYALSLSSPGLAQP